MPNFLMSTPPDGIIYKYQLNPGGQMNGILAPSIVTYQYVVDQNFTRYVNVSFPFKVKVEDVRNSFRAALDYATETDLEKKYEPINLFQLKDSTSEDILRMFYDNVSYGYDMPTRPTGKGDAKILKELKRTMGGETEKGNGKNTISTTGDESVLCCIIK